MTREQAKEYPSLNGGMYSYDYYNNRQLRDDAYWFIIDKIYDDLEDQSCMDCKWVKLMGEDENDECHNTSGSAHLLAGTIISLDFWCNRFEPKETK